MPHAASTEEKADGTIGPSGLVDDGVDGTQHEPGRRRNGAQRFAGLAQFADLRLLRIARWLLRLPVILADFPQDPIEIRRSRQQPARA
jgi:hypothetical protein